MPDIIKGCKLCLCQFDGEYVDGIHIEFLNAEGKIYPVPVNTKVNHKQFEYELGYFDERRCISYIINGSAYISEGYVWIQIDNKVAKTCITEEEFNFMINEKVR